MASLGHNELNSVINLRVRVPADHQMANICLQRYIFIEVYADINIFKLEQLERLRSEDTPRRLMFTHTIKLYWIPSQKKTKSKWQI